jgi:hypothetical protein
LVCRPKKLDKSREGALLQVYCTQQSATCLSNLTERAGFYLPSLCKVLNNLILQLNSNDSKDLNSLVDLLFLHDFLLSRDAF